jgi:hypothetical protein
MSTSRLGVLSPAFLSHRSSVRTVVSATRNMSATVLTFSTPASSWPPYIAAAFVLPALVLAIGSSPTSDCCTDRAPLQRHYSWRRAPPRDRLRPLACLQLPAPMPNRPAPTSKRVAGSGAIDAVV